MVFYFTGTGNSYDAALQIAGDDRLISITECVQNKTFDFCPEEGESVGFVFPVYFAGLPSIVAHFIDNFYLEEDPAYMYAVITCGGSIFGAGGMLADHLDENGYILDAVYSVEMPDNYILMYEPDDEAEQMRILEASKAPLAKIKEQIENHVVNETRPSGKDRATTALLYPFYVHGRKTKKFWVDDQCIGCGTCVKRCPAKAMEMKDGKPIWIKDKCIQCLSCVRCGAIQYGKKTVGRKRYTNPVLKKKACH